MQTRMIAAVGVFAIWGGLIACNNSRKGDKPTADPNSPESLYVRGFDLLQAEQTEEGIQLLERAAALGNRDAQTTLGMVYYKWTGVTPDLDKSIAYYTKAAERGDTLAQENLAGVYAPLRETGMTLGMPYTGKKDLKKAYFWYQVCLESREDTGASSPVAIDEFGRSHGNQADCATDLEVVKKYLKPTAINDIDRRVGDWFAHHPDLYAQTSRKHK